MTDNVYPDALGAVTAFGDGDDNNAQAFAFVVAEFANAPGLVFPHELAHLFGARHEDRGICPGDGDDSGLTHAHGFIIEKGINLIVTKKRQWRTVMGVCGRGAIPRIPYYSNPDVEFKNRDTGTSEKNNNARILREAACRVANYVNTDFPAVFIEGPTYWCPGEFVTVQGVISGVPEPYEYQWQTTTNGFTWSTPTISSFNGFSLEMPFITGNVIGIRLTGGNANGPMLSTTHYIESNNTTIYCQRGNVKRNENTTNYFDIIPNPSTGSFLINILETDLQLINIIITDFLGRTIAVFDESYMLDGETISINLNNVASGFYYLQVNTHDKRHTQVIFINQ